MNFQVVVHKAEEGGYWAEVPAIPGCATQGETCEELQEESVRSDRGLSVDRHINNPSVAPRTSRTGAAAVVLRVWKSRRRCIAKLHERSLRPDDQSRRARLYRACRYHFSYRRHVPLLAGLVIPGHFYRLFDGYHRVYGALRREASGAAPARRTAG